MSCTMGSLRCKKNIKDKLSATTQVDELMPHDLINSKVITTLFLSFSQGGNYRNLWIRPTHFLKLITKRRLSALGEGGLSKERAGFDARDVHPYPLWKDMPC